MFVLTAGPYCSLRHKHWRPTQGEVSQMFPVVLLYITFVTFDPSCDVQEVVLVVSSQVSWVQPAVLVESLCGFVGHVQVAHEDVSTPETNLSVPVFIWILQLHLAAWHHLSTAGRTNHKSITWYDLMVTKRCTTTSLCMLVVKRDTSVLYWPASTGFQWNIELIILFVYKAWLLLFVPHSQSK